MSFDSQVRDIPDFPKTGIIFRDITPLLKNQKKFKEVIDHLAEQLDEKQVTAVVGIESRGFIFGSVLAYRLGCSFIPARKKGKLPHTTVSADYELEYGTDSIEMHQDAINENDHVVIIDDLLATGGTAKAVVDLVKQLKANIHSILFFIELSFLNGRNQIKDHPVYSVLTY